MTALNQHIDRLLQWLDDIGLSVPSRNIRIVDLSDAQVNEDTRKIRISRNEIRTPAEYELRFDELLAAGYPWLNLSCYGLFEDCLLLCVEVPCPRELDPGRPTSVNLSGPARAVLDQNWNVDAVLIVEP